MAEIVEFSRAKARDEATDNRLRRLALQIATQLPEDHEEALGVLEHLETLVRSFLTDSRPA